MSRGVCVQYAMVDGIIQRDDEGRELFELYFGGQFVMRRHNDDAWLTAVANTITKGAENLGIEPDAKGCPGEASGPDDPATSGYIKVPYETWDYLNALRNSLPALLRCIEAADNAILPALGYNPGEKERKEEAYRQARAELEES